MSEAGCPAADATSDSGPDHLPPAPMQSAQCSAVRGGPAGRRSHPGRREMETDYRLDYISLLNMPSIATKNIYLYGSYILYIHTELTLCLYWVVCQINIFGICLGSLLDIHIHRHIHICHFALWRASIDNYILHSVHL